MHPAPPVVLVGPPPPPWVPCPVAPRTWQYLLHGGEGRTTGLEGLCFECLPCRQLSFRAQGGTVLSATQERAQQWVMHCAPPMAGRQAGGQHAPARDCLNRRAGWRRRQNMASQQADLPTNTKYARPGHAMLRGRQMRRACKLNPPVTLQALPSSASLYVGSVGAAHGLGAEHDLGVAAVTVAFDQQLPGLCRAAIRRAGRGMHTMVAAPW